MIRKWPTIGSYTEISSSQLNSLDYLHFHYKCQFQNFKAQNQCSQIDIVYPTYKKNSKMLCPKLLKLKGSLKNSTPNSLRLCCYCILRSANQCPNTLSPYGFRDVASFVEIENDNYRESIVGAIDDSEYFISNKYIRYMFTYR